MLTSQVRDVIGRVAKAALEREVDEGDLAADRPRRLDVRAVVRPQHHEMVVRPQHAGRREKERAGGAGCQQHLTRIAPCFLGQQGAQPRIPAMIAVQQHRRREVHIEVELAQHPVAH
jgi:hypothetical protein